MVSMHHKLTSYLSCVYFSHFTDEQTEAHYYYY